MAYEFTQTITHTLLKDAYKEFKRKYPLEEPHIRVICMRKHKHINQDMKFKGSWRKTFIDNDTVQEEVYEPKFTMKEVKVEINPNKPAPRKLPGDLARIKEVKRDNDKRIAERERIIETRFFSPDLEPRGEFIVDGTERNYDNTIAISGDNITSFINTSSTYKIPNSIMITDEPLEQFDFESVKTLFQEAISRNRKLIGNDETTLRENANRITNYGGQSVGTQTPVYRSGIELWRIFKKRYRFAIGLIKMKIDFNSRLRALIKDYDESGKMMMRDHELKCKTLEFQISDLKDSLDEYDSKLKSIQKLDVRIKKSIAGNKSIEDICDSYFVIQKRLNEVRSYVSTIAKDYAFGYEQSVKEKGFILSLIDFLKYFHTGQNYRDDDGSDYE